MCPPYAEGAGNAGGALHPRSHTQMEKGAHEHTGSAEAPGIPCVAALRLMPRSPRRRIRLVTVVGGCKRHFDPVGSNLSPPTWHQQRVSGPHGFAVRSKRRSSCASSRTAHRSFENPPCDPWRADALASTTSRPAFVTIAIRPSCRNGTGDLKPLIWGRCEAQSCPSCHCAAALSLVIPGSRQVAHPELVNHIALPHSRQGGVSLLEATQWALQQQSAIQVWSKIPNAEQAGDLYRCRCREGS